MNKIITYSIIFFILLSCNEQKQATNNSTESTSIDRKKDTTPKKAVLIYSRVVNIDSLDSIKANGKVPFSSYEDVKNLPVEKIDIHPYIFDTILSNDYYLSYKVYKDSMDFMQSLTLKHGGKTIKTISECSFPLLHKNLGYIGADFNKSFVFVQSFGSGNPHFIQLIDKKSGNIIKSGVWVDVNEEEEVLLYIENPYEENEKFKLFDIKNNKETIINDFYDTECATKIIGGIRDCVRIDTITQSDIILKNEWEGKYISRKYKR